MLAVLVCSACVSGVSVVILCHSVVTVVDFSAGKQVEPMLLGITNHIMEHLLDNGFYTVMRVSESTAT